MGTHTKTTRVSEVAVLSLLAMACGTGGGPTVGGQSGTERPNSNDDLFGTESADGLAPACGCVVGVRAVAVRAELIEYGPCEMTARVTRVLYAAGRPAPVVGEEIAAMPQQCLAPNAPQPEPGDDLLLLYNAGNDTPMRLDDGTTVVTEPPSIAWAPYGEPLQFEGLPDGVYFPPSDVGTLLDLESCNEWVRTRVSASSNVGAGKGGGLLFGTGRGTEDSVFLPTGQLENDLLMDGGNAADGGVLVSGDALPPDLAAASGAPSGAASGAASGEAPEQNEDDPVDEDSELEFPEDPDDGRRVEDLPACP